MTSKRSSPGPSRYERSGNRDGPKSLKLIIPEHVYQPRDEKTVTIWHTITLWGKDAENAHARLAKGSVIEATCSISYHKTEDGRFYTNFNVRVVGCLANFGKNKRPEKQPNPKTPTRKRPDRKRHLSRGAFSSVSKKGGHHG